MTLHCKDTLPWRDAVVQTLPFNNKVVKKKALMTGYPEELRTVLSFHIKVKQVWTIFHIMIKQGELYKHPMR